MAAAALPFYAFVQGHPYRVRYTIVLVVATAVLSGVLVGLLHRKWPRAGAAFGVGLVVAVVARHPPLEADAPMVREAQWDAAHSRGRSAVTAYLSREWDGQPIMASMGSLAHYMQETSRAGFRIKDYLHEGNGDLWKEALKSPHPHAAWILIEERAEGGDMLAALTRGRIRRFSRDTRASPKAAASRCIAGSRSAKSEDVNCVVNPPRNRSSLPRNASSPRSSGSVPVASCHRSSSPPTHGSAT